MPAALLSPNFSQAGDDVTQDNDGIDSTVGDVASGNFANNTDKSDDDFIDADTTTNIDDIASNNDYLSDNKYEDESDDDVVDNKAGIMDQDLVDNKDGKMDNDLLDVDTEVKDNETNVASKNDILSNNKYEDESDDDVVDNKDGNMDNDLIDQDDTDNDLVDNKGGNMDNDLVDNDSHDNDNDLADNDMNDNVAAAAMGGFALGIKIDDIELNLAATTNVSGIYQNSQFGAGAGQLGLFNDDASVEYEGNCNHIDASVYDNTGIQAASFTAGNFNNSANMNNVTMTVQW